MVRNLKKGRLQTRTVLRAVKTFARRRYARALS
jgi:hypothetical protein